jgi:phosphatidate cytidylyltransferase
VKTRVLSAAILAPLALALVVAGGAPFLVGVTVMCGLATWEAGALFAAIAGTTVSASWRSLIVVTAGILLLGIQLAQVHPAAAGLAASSILVLSLGALVASGPPAKRFLSWALGAATLVYVVGLGGHAVLLRDGSHGLAWTLVACAGTWGTDIGAFYAGRRYGRHTFFAAISPRKTTEGALGGLASGALGAALVALLARLPISPGAALLLGLVVSAAAQAGDLAESLLKREAGVKDSGTLIPGHGGMLDRIDSLLFALTVTYYGSILLT